MEALQRVLNAFCVADRNEDPDPYQPPIAQEPSFESVMGILQLDNAQKAPSRSSSFKANFENSVASDLDPFLLLSPELRLGIAQYLPTVNFLNLRLSSKAMVLIFDRQDFWKTRFCLYGDRGFLDFLESQSRVLNDLWQQWIHNQMIRDMYLMTGAPGLVPLADNTRDPSLKWTGTQAAQQGFFDDDPPKIDGCLRHYYRQKLFVSKDNCDKFSLLKHARFSQTIALPGRVLAIAVSVFTEGTLVSKDFPEHIEQLDAKSEILALYETFDDHRIMTL
ncbi:uncharacterized protein N7483_000225 [Penicillium malachiteum]|uniref:uncharacterized protein n=1 Tax=Penicillium malachiteum TaxID=1324776 RepID=UPI002549436D|nr:uncharacterized protein N7483_000225 [Penicillium malachiteum]KAJ5735100.1 hypothetical protein N7483_000225 [Penicillium malachiteum]